MKPTDLSGSRFGRLVVTKMCRNDRRMMCVCVCDCGELKSVQPSDLRAGKTRSCGCLRRESSSVNGLARKTHGLSAIRRNLYDVWRQMHQRCSNPKCKDYPLWGGRGVFVCAAWADPNAFAAWADNSGYRQGVTIERKDNALGYSPANCHWIPNRAQARNTRRRRYMTVGGKRCSIDEISTTQGISYTTIVSRLNRGWSGDDAANIRPIIGRNQFG